jgi:D-3-phosphoglycerate dehydrogenase / 2-oxoglutarate reductase
MKRVLITDDCHPLLKDGLKELGFECDDQPDISYADTCRIIGAYQGLIINSKILVNATFLDAATQLRFVARLGSGMEIVDREYAAQKGVAVLSSPEGNRNAVAEQALGMLLAWSNNLLRSDREVRRMEWHREANRGWEIDGKTIGIIGFGHTGSRFARKLAGFDARVLAYDKYKTEYTRDYPRVHRASGPEQIQQEADIISLHLPLTPETRHYFNKAFIDQCKTGVVLINTSRGSCVDTAALVAALESGKMGGACLDVFENEKPATYSEAEKVLFERLAKLDNVVLSPHVAGWTHESKRLLAEILLNKIKEVL